MKATYHIFPECETCNLDLIGACTISFGGKSCSNPNVNAESLSYGGNTVAPTVPRTITIRVNGGEPMEGWLSVLQAIQYIKATYTIDEIVQALVDDQGKETIKQAVERSR